MHILFASNYWREEKRNEYITLFHKNIISHTTLKMCKINQYNAFKKLSVNFVKIT